MKSKTVHKIAHKLIQQKERGESTVIFLGAGASKSAGIPIADGMTDYIKSNDNLSSFIDPKSTDYFQVMEDLDSGDRKRVLMHFISKSRINLTHLIIGILVKIGLVDCIITTNFDPLMKRTLSLLNCKNQVYDIANNVRLDGFIPFYPAVFYLHGESTNVWQFNTRAELKKRSGRIRSIIDKVGSTRTWIVIGYSGDDLVFDKLTQTEKFDEGLYWIGYNNHDPIKKVKSKLLSKPEKNAYFISGYDSDSFFRKLFNEIQSLESFKLEALKHLQLSLMCHKQFEEKLELVSVPDFKLSVDCEKWINKKIFENSLQDQKKARKSSFWQRIKHKISSIFIIGNYYEIRKDIRKGTPSVALIRINQLIENGTDGPLSYYWKGVALGQQAQSLEDPREAQSIYENMNNAFAKAQELGSQMEEPPSELNRIGPVKNSLWRVAHSTGADYVTDDSLMQATENPYQVALAYFDNATIIQPDSALSWSAKAQMHANLNNYADAIQAQERYIELGDDLEAQAYLLLAQYYRNNDQPKESIVILEYAREKFPENNQVIEILADSYTQVGESEKAIAMVRELIKENPEEPRYRLSLGTRIFQSTIPMHETYDENVDKIFNLSQKLRNASGEEADKIKQQIQELKNKNAKLRQEINDLMDEAIAEIKASLENQKDEPAAYNTLGYIYQNKASLVFSQRNMLSPDNEQFEKLDKQGKDFLRKAMENYEKAVELDSENTIYYKSLVPVYRAMGMEKKAEKAKRKLLDLDNNL